MPQKGVGGGSQERRVLGGHKRSKQQHPERPPAFVSVPVEIPIFRSREQIEPLYSGFRCNASKIRPGKLKGVVSSAFCATFVQLVARLRHQHHGETPAPTTATHGNSHYAQ